MKKPEEAQAPKTQTLKFTKGEKGVLLINGKSEFECFGVLEMFCDHEISVQIPEGTWPQMA